MKTETRSALLNRLLEIQGERPDAEMAREFGVVRSYWHHIRVGRREMSLNMIRRAIALYPELEEYHIRDMRGGVA